jgi:hypothetical protein
MLIHRNVLNAALAGSTSKPRVPLSVEVLEKICRAAKAAAAGHPVRSRSGKLLPPVVTLCIPTDPAAQWTTTDAGGDKQPNGVLATALRLEITAPTVEIEGAAMPVDLG